MFDDDDGYCLSCGLLDACGPCTSTDCQRKVHEWELAAAREEGYRAGYHDGFRAGRGEEATDV